MRAAWLAAGNEGAVVIEIMDVCVLRWNIIVYGVWRKEILYQAKIRWGEGPAKALHDFKNSEGTDKQEFLHHKGWLNFVGRWRKQ